MHTLKDNSVSFLPWFWKLNGKKKNVSVNIQQNEATTLKEAVDANLNNSGLKLFKNDTNQVLFFFFADLIIIQSLHLHDGRAWLISKYNWNPFRGCSSWEHATFFAIWKKMELFVANQQHSKKKNLRFLPHSHSSYFCLCKLLLCRKFGGCCGWSDTEDFLEDVRRCCLEVLLSVPSSLHFTRYTFVMTIWTRMIGRLDMIGSKQVFPSLWKLRQIHWLRKVSPIPFKFDFFLANRIEQFKMFVMSHFIQAFKSQNYLQRFWLCSVVDRWTWRCSDYNRNRMWKKGRNLE